MHEAQMDWVDEGIMVLLHDWSTGEDNNEDIFHTILSYYCKEKVKHQMWQIWILFRCTAVLILVLNTVLEVGGQ